MSVTYSTLAGEPLIRGIEPFDPVPSGLSVPGEFRETLELLAQRSLRADATARSGDALPDSGDPSRRGWWADIYGARATDRFGSRLWLLRRSRLDAEVLSAAEDFAAEALQWMLDDGLATTLTISASVGGLRRDRLDLSIVVTRKDGGTENMRYSSLWEAQRG